MKLQDKCESSEERDKETYNFKELRLCKNNSWNLFSGGNNEIVGIHFRNPKRI